MYLCHLVNKVNFVLIQSFIYSNVYFYMPEHCQHDPLY